MPPTWPALRARRAANEWRRRYALWVLFGRSILAGQPFACPESLCGCGLRGLKGTTPTKRTTEDSVSSQMVLTQDLLISEMSRSEQKSSLPASVRLLGTDLIR